MNGRRLIILDLNGTILNRLTHEREFKAFRSHPRLPKSSLVSDVTVHGSKVIFRPHCHRFLAHLLQNFDVAVWTSSRPKNAFAMVHHTFGSLLDFNTLWKQSQPYSLTPRDILLGSSDAKALLRQEELLSSTAGQSALQFIWTQEECDTVSNQLVAADSTSTKYMKPLRKKNLNKVWAAFPQYNESNTIIVDDTQAKLADHNENHLVIPEFTVIDHEIDFTCDKHLLSLEAYFDVLLAENPSDLRHYLCNKPFIQ